MTKRAAVLVLALAGCLPDRTLPPDAIIPCVSQADCPSTHVCRPALGRCLPAATLDDVPPAFVAPLSVTPARVSRVPGQDVVTARFTVDDPGAAVTVEAAGSPLTCTTSAPGAYECARALADGDVEGRLDVDVVAVDAEGNESRARESTEIDLTAPQPIAAALLLEPGPANPLRTVAALTSESVAHLTVNVDEPFGAAPAASAACTGATLSFTLVDGGAGLPFARFDLALGAADVAADGPCTIELDGVDDVGNAAVRSLDDALAAGGAEPLRIDRTPPDGAVRAEQLLHLRLPFGAARTAGAAGHFLVPAGLDAATDPATAALPAAAFALPGENIVEARVYTPAGQLLAIIDAGGGGRLFDVDTPAIVVSAIDDAGNESTPVPVAGEWVVGAAGGTNPSSFLLARRFGPARAQDASSSDVASATERELAGADDGLALGVSGSGRWEELTPPTQLPAGRTDHGVAWDGARDRVVLLDGASPLGDAEDHWEAAGDGLRFAPLASTLRPPTRLGYALVWDARRGRVLLFGGLGDDGPLGDLWEWDGQTWRERAPAAGPAPPPLVYAALVYDSRRGQVLLFGGGDLAGPAAFATDELWRWDEDAGVDGGWQLLSGGAAAGAGAPGPSPRNGASVVYDGTRDRVVVFGGAVGFADVKADTWEWDPAASAWLERTPTALAPSPPPRHTAATVYDEARQRTVVFAGVDAAANDYRDDTWLWDGAAGTWTEDAGPRPPKRAFVSMTWDAARRRAVLFGGQTGADLNEFLAHDDTWTWDAAGWTEHVTSTSRPPARVSPLLAFDGLRRALVLFGGSAADASALADTWRWDGAVWTELAPAAPPPPPGAEGGEPEPVFHEARGTLVAVNNNVTFEWDGDAWTAPVNAAGELIGPSADGSVGLRKLAYDRARGVVVAFGGVRFFEDGSVDVDGETWEWDGSAVGWQLVAPAGAAPAPRFQHALGYLGSRERVVLFGGRRSFAQPARAEQLDDTWEWDGAAWTERQPTQRPPPRRFHRLVEDTTRARLLTVGGVGRVFADDTEMHEWDGDAWTRVEQPVATGPGTRVQHGAAYDEERRVVLVTGNNLASDDLWAWHSGAGDRPAAIWLVPTASSQTEPAALTELEVVVDAAAAGPAGAAAGFDVLAWDTGASSWQPLAASDDGAGVVVSVLDGAAVAFSVFGDERELAVAIVPRALSDGTVMARIDVDAVELRLRYGSAP